MMRRLTRPAATLAILLFAAACSHHTDLKKSSTQDDFGVQMARMNLWREALFRFRRAVEINPKDAMAHNNLAVAYEANGDFENARKEYLEALKLDRSNAYIQKNYSRYVEFLSRNKKRAAPKAAATAPAVPAPRGTGLTEVAVPPDKPEAMNKPKPTEPPAPQPVDIPPPPPPTPPPGGAR